MRARSAGTAGMTKHGCDGPDWADPHNAPACTAASPPDLDGPPRSSNRVVKCPSQRELGSLKGLPLLPGKRAIVSGVHKRKTTEETRKEVEDDRISPDVSRGSQGCAEPSAPFEGCGQKEKSRKPVVPFGDEGNRLRGARREYPPRFRRSMAEEGAWGHPEQGKGGREAEGFIGEKGWRAQRTYDNRSEGDWV
ncbi:hypothetical protein NDU88_002621 [Pleurodeles waltl]|uniref:Uncharacterized protein n=1 Tax=Pleurodeles waltl TaxID=8319 RepID=A0AAV7MTB6_PLEWA|nr:hypothetical protein NDU88_002621 [Pleurodeles waltl]